MDESLQTRREFCVSTCQVISTVAIGGVLATLLESCNKSNPVSPNEGNLSTIQGSAINGRITLAIDSNSPLSSVGSAALVKYANGILLVAHLSADTFVALSGICTHQGCTITSYGSQIFTCLCHGSEFNTSGQVVRGPASSPLAEYPTQFASNSLIITVG